MREDVVHVSVRAHLRAAGWCLLGGQYPNGSDDELPAINVMDPVLARDCSPDHRRHSKNKLVPDLVATRHRFLLVIEMKPEYSAEDEQKLRTLLAERRHDFLAAVRQVMEARETCLCTPLTRMTIVPALGFGATSGYTPSADFCYFRVSQLYSVSFEGNPVLPVL